MSNYYQYFQPNPKDKNNKIGDCAIRCYCKAENIDWITAYDKMFMLSKKVYAPMNDRKGFNYIMKQSNYEYKGISNAKGSKRPTVESFARDNPKGTFIANVAHHFVAIVDGKYYDSWDSGNKSLYGYYTKK